MSPGAKAVNKLWRRITRSVPGETQLSFAGLPLAAMWKPKANAWRKQRRSSSLRSPLSRAGYLRAADHLRLLWRPECLLWVNSSS